MRYNRGMSPRGPAMGVWRLTPAIKWIMIANAAIYVITLLTYHWVKTDFMVIHLSLTPERVIPGLEIWQPLTYMWMHDPTGPGHLVFNMFGLWMFGTLLEDRWGKKGLLKFYLLTGFLAGMVVVVAGWLTGKAGTLTLGASGGIFAVIIAFGMLFPNTRIYFFGLLPIKAKWIVYATIGITLLYWLARTPGISIAAHAGGMASAAILISGWWNPFKAMRSIRAFFLRRKMRVIEREIEERAKRGPDDDDDKDEPIYH